jgi:hypothetical protein
MHTLDNMKEDLESLTVGGSRYGNDLLQRSDMKQLAPYEMGDIALLLAGHTCL